jgi:hypothetical protein
MESVPWKSVIGDASGPQETRQADAAALAQLQCAFSMTGILWLEGALKRDPAIDVWLDAQSAELGSIARTWFCRMRGCGDDVRELIHDGCPVECVGDAPFGYVNVFRAHVNVGFFLGAELPDPAGLLQGGGRRMRHAKLRPGEDFDAAALRALIEVAYVDIKSRLVID